LFDTATVFFYVPTLPSAVNRALILLALDLSEHLKLEAWNEKDYFGTFIMHRGFVHGYPF
jgi:hypothetical protein